MSGPADLRMARGNPCYSEAPDRLMALLENVFANAPSTTDYDADAQFIQGLTCGQRAFWLTLLLDGDVSNGGFAQYFSNPAGAFAPETLKELLVLGAVDHARLLERAIAVFPPSGFPRDTQVRNDILDALPDEVDVTLSELDDAFYALDDSGNGLRDYWERYVQAHPDQFFK